MSVGFVPATNPAPPPLPDNGKGRMTTSHIIVAFTGVLFVIASSSVHAMDLLLYDGSHRADRTRDSSVTVDLTAPSLGSVWAAGARGEMLRDSGGGWERFASVSTGSADGVHDDGASIKDQVLFPPPSVAGDWAAGEGHEILRDVSSDHFEVVTTSRRTTKVFTTPILLYPPNPGGDWAGGDVGSTVYNVGDAWYTVTTANLKTPRKAALPLYSDTGAPLKGASCIFYGSENATAGLPSGAGKGVGGSALHFRPDKWHAGSYNLYCGGGVRTDLRQYNMVSFAIRFLESAGAGGGVDHNHTFQLSTWNSQSNKIRIKDYLRAGEALGTEWRTVTIPLQDLATDSWDLSNVERVAWPNTLSGEYFVDDVIVTDDAALSNVQSTVVDVAGNRTIRGIARSATTRQIVAVGDAGTILRIRPDHGIQWVAEPSPVMQDLHAVWMAHPSLGPVTPPRPPLHEWAVGAKGTLLRRSITITHASKWQQVDPGTATTILHVGDLHGITGIVRTDDVRPSPRSTVVNPVESELVWAVGANGAILHYDGDNWQRCAVDTSATLRAVFAISTTNVIAVGDDGVVVRFDGKEWKVDSTVPGVDRALFGVWATGDAHIWVCGERGTLWFYGGESTGGWARVSVPTTEDLFAVSGNRENDVFAVGSNGVAVVRHWDGKWKLAGCEHFGHPETFCKSVSPHGASLYAALGGGKCIFYGREVRGAGVNGSGPALELRGDAWHAPALDLFCGSGGRRDFTRHSMLQFDTQMHGEGAEYATLKLSTWNQDGPEVPLRKYFVDEMSVAASGASGAAGWQRVAIPLSDLAMPDWPLHNVQRIVIGNNSQTCGDVSFGPSARCHVYMIDRVQLIDETGRMLSPPTTSSTGQLTSKRHRAVCHDAPDRGCRGRRDDTAHTS